MIFALTAIYAVRIIFSRGVIALMNRRAGASLFVYKGNFLLSLVGALCLLAIVLSALSLI